ncbi:(2Fe-2S)-binding protein [Elioraea sp.]|uniref:(2Fe-2S)-binding protein n=1 Tax=Elioraea sp. TaxID=2185103 RepID=UPI003F6FE2C0
MRLVRRADTERARILFSLDGAPAEALAGDTLMTAILTNAGHLRTSEFGDGTRAGFCWMGACQDCFVWVEGLGRVRACATLLEPGMAVRRA